MKTKRVRRVQYIAGSELLAFNQILGVMYDFMRANAAKVTLAVRHSPPPDGVRMCAFLVTEHDTPIMEEPNES